MAAALAPESARREALADLQNQIERLVLNLPEYGELTMTLRVHDYRIVRVQLGSAASRELRREVKGATR